MDTLEIEKQKSNQIRRFYLCDLFCKKVKTINSVSNDYTGSNN